MNEPFQRRGNGYAVSRDLNPRLVAVASCKPRETRKHPPGQLRKLAASLDRFGFVLARPDGGGRHRPARQGEIQRLACAPSLLCILVTLADLEDENELEL
jgi:hypothetical protein